MTDKKSKHPQDPQNGPHYEEEINLVDLLRVIWKWKWLIIAGPLFFAAIAAVVSLQMPKIYEVSTIIEPAVAMVQDNGNVLYFDSVASISGKIRGGIYNKEIQRALGLDSQNSNFGFEAVILQGTSTIKVTSQWEEGKTDLGVKITQQLNDLLFNEYAKIVELKKEIYDTQIVMKQREIDEIKTERKDIDEQITLMLNEIVKKRHQIKQRQDSLENSRQRKDELVKEIERVEESAKEIVRQRTSLLKDKNPEKDISLIINSTMIQQNMIYSNHLHNSVYDLIIKENQMEAETDQLNREIDTIGTDIKRLNLKKPEIQNDIADNETSIKRLNLEKETIRDIAVIASPEVSSHPVKPNKKKIIFLTGFVSLFVFGLLPFFIEYMRTYRKRGEKKS